MPILDVRHEQTRRLRRRGHREADPPPRAGRADRRARHHQRRQRGRHGALQRLAGRRARGPGAADSNWGKGALQELDHPPLLAPVTKRAATVHETPTLAVGPRRRLRAGRLARTAGRSSSTCPLERPSAADDRPLPARSRRASASEPDADDLGEGGPAARAGPASRCWCSAPTSGATAPRRRPGRCAEATGVPVDHQRHGARRPARRARQLVTRARGAAFGGADLVVVAGTPLDFRLGYGLFGGRDGNPLAAVVHLADSPGRSRRTSGWPARPPATCPRSSTGSWRHGRRLRPPGRTRDWLGDAPGHRRQGGRLRRPAC